MRLGAFKLKPEEETKLEVPSGMSLLFKSPVKQSVATTLRSKETLASMAVQSSESERKRKASGSQEILKQEDSKKRRKSPERMLVFTTFFDF